MEKGMDIEITPRELKRLLDDAKVAQTKVVESNPQDDRLTVLDVREFWERQTACIAESRHIPMDEVASRLEELDPGRRIVVYCHHGVRSLAVTGWLRTQGYAQAQSMSGGLDQWSREIDPGVPRY
jgi:rhodanese-related sulfurtransferase